MLAKVHKVKTERPASYIFLDRWRGFSCLLMLFHHLLYDLVFLFALELGLGESFFYTLHLITVMSFLAVSGATAALSERQSKRGLMRQILAALGLALLTSLVSLISGENLFIFWNLLMLLALARFHLYICRQLPERFYLPGIALGGMLWTALAILSRPLLWHLPPQIDYLSTWPWLLYFLGFYMLFYLLWRRTSWRQRMQQGRAKDPLAFLGRHALAFYFLHQPLLILILQVIFYALR